MTTKDLHYVSLRGVLYFRAGDIADYIRDLASGEETDVRNRLNEAADNIVKKQTEFDEQHASNSRLLPVE